MTRSTRGSFGFIQISIQMRQRFSESAAARVQMPAYCCWRRSGQLGDFGYRGTLQVEHLDYQSLSWRHGRDDASNVLKQLDALGGVVRRDVTARMCVEQHLTGA